MMSLFPTGMDRSARAALLMEAGGLGYAALMTSLLASTGAGGAVVIAFMLVLPVMLSLWTVMALLVASGDWDPQTAFVPSALAGVLGVEAIYLPLALVGPPGGGGGQLFSVAEGQALALLLGLAWGTGVGAALPHVCAETIRLDHILVATAAGALGALTLPAVWAALLGARAAGILPVAQASPAMASLVGLLGLPAAYACGTLVALVYARFSARDADRPGARGSGIDRLYDAR